MSSVPHSDPLQQFSGALHNTARAWRQGIDRQLKDLGVSQAGWMTIAMVARTAEPLSQKQLADLLGVEGPTIVAMVDRLVTAQMVVREASLLDRRVKLIRLTPAGDALYARVKVAADAFRISVLAGLDPAAIDAATALMDTIRARIEAQL
ncbi:MAG: MarR family transcriptional regulator [Pseudomonadota bacterium]|nr:MarR family transcriptional regulator [Pseudomonadota bacterium]